MKVLILDFDLFTDEGDGHNVYKKLIKENSHISFYYYKKLEGKDCYRPNNAFLINLENYHQSFLNNSYSKKFKEAYIQANQMALSVQNQCFDIIDIPDYCHAGIFVRPAFQKYDVKFKSIVLAMHGGLSKISEHDWENNTISSSQELKQIKTFNYLSADIRYSYDKRLLKTWEERTKIKGQYVSPFNFIKIEQTKNFIQSNSKPLMCYLGQLNKQSQPNLFIDLLWMLSSSLYREAFIISPDYSNENIARSINQIINNRKVKINIFSRVNQKNNLFSEKLVLFTSFREDHFDLFSLEAFLSGLPIVLAKNSSLANFIKEEFKDLDPLILDKNDIFKSVNQIKDLLENYDLYRKNLIESIKKIEFSHPFLSIKDIYKN